MKLPKGCTVAVSDGEKLVLFHNTGDEAEPRLAAAPHAHVEENHSGVGSQHHSTSANPEDGDVDKAGFAAGVAQVLNAQMAAGKITKLLVIAAPKTLGELRRHYDKKLEAHLVGEIAKDLTGSTAHDIEQTIAAA